MPHPSVFWGVACHAGHDHEVVRPVLRVSVPVPVKVQILVTGGLCRVWVSQTRGVIVYVPFTENTAVSSSARPC